MFCNAKHYTFELSQDKNFSTCCHKGKRNLQEDPTYPREIEELVTGNTCISKNFKQFNRYYNNALALASFGVTFAKLPGNGPSVVRICGQVYHSTYALHHNEEDRRKYG